MIIGIDISQIVYKGSGVARYTEGVVNAILEFDTKNTWYFYFSSLRQTLDPQLAERIRAKKHVLCLYKYPPTFLSWYWNDMRSVSTKLPSLYNIPGNMDWFITSDWAEPPLSVKKATIIHDLVYKKYPETLHPSIVKTQKKRLQHVARESDLIVCVSQSTKRDLLNEFSIDSKKILVTYTGIPVPSSSKVPRKITDLYPLHKPYILTVGKLEPRKNIERLIKAFKKTDTTAQLVIVGDTGWGGAHQNNSENIVFLGYVPDEHLQLLYQQALFFVYPSLYEGFGYPVIEAMSYGCPVGTSNSSSLKEIARETALLFDPMDVDSIRDAIQKLFDDEKLREDLRTKGKAHSEKFTWKRYFDTFVKRLDM